VVGSGLATALDAICTEIDGLQVDDRQQACMARADVVADLSTQRCGKSRRARSGRGPK
jgi:hypothetical protein